MVISRLAHLRLPLQSQCHFGLVIVLRNHLEAMLLIESYCKVILKCDLEFHQLKSEALCVRDASLDQDRCNTPALPLFQYAYAGYECYHARLRIVISCDKSNERGIDPGFKPFRLLVQFG